VGLRSAATWSHRNPPDSLLPIARSILEEMKAADYQYGILSSGPISAQELLPVLAPVFDWGGLDALQWYFYSNSARHLSQAIVRSRTDPTVNVGQGFDVFLGYADETTAANEFTTDYGPLPRATLAFLGLPEDGSRFYSTDTAASSPLPAPVTDSFLNLPLVKLTCDADALVLVFGTAHDFQVSIRQRPHVTVVDPDAHYSYITEKIDPTSPLRKALETQVGQLIIAARIRREGSLEVSLSPTQTSKGRSFSIGIAANAYFQGWELANPAGAISSPGAGGWVKHLRDHPLIIPSTANRAAGRAGDGIAECCE
jgi:hypothetical protein